MRNKYKHLKDKKCIKMCKKMDTNSLRPLQFHQIKMFL